MQKTAALLLLAFAAAMAQVNTSTLDGLVTDPQGAFVPRVDIVVTNTLTAQTFRTVTDSKGHWAVPSLPTATYSAHWVRDPALRRAIDDFLKRERRYIQEQIDGLAEAGPFRHELASPECSED